MPSDWLVEDWYHYNGAHLIGGPMGAGKTCLEMSLMKAAMEGKSWLGKKTSRPERWVQIVTDRGMGNREYWAGVYGIDLPGPDATYCVDDNVKDRPKFGSDSVMVRVKASVAWLAKKLEMLKPHPKGVVTIDVATPFFAPSQSDYSTGFWTTKDLKEVFAEFPSCYLLLTHGGKYRKFDAAARLVDRIIGNTGTLGQMDTLSYISSPDEATDLKIQDAQWFSVLPRMSKRVLMVVKQGETGRLEQVEAPQEEATEPEPSPNIGGRPQKLTMEDLMEQVPADPGRLHFSQLAEKITKTYKVAMSTIQRRVKEAREQGLIYDDRLGLYKEAAKQEAKTQT